MGRKPSNKFQETSIEFKKGTEFRLFDVKFPLLSKVTFENTDPKFAKGQSEQVVSISASEKERITKLFADKGFLVIKIEPYTMQVPEICPTCNKKGVPKIEKKNTVDKRYRNWKFKDKISPKTRPHEYWLVFVHDSKSKCRISRFIPLPHPSWRTQTDSKLPYTKFMFPYNFGWLKSQLSQ